MAKQLQQEDPMVFLHLENDVSATDLKTTELENFWTDIHALTNSVGRKMFGKPDNPRFSFEIVSDSKGARFYMGVPKRYVNVIMKKLNAVYPYIDIEEVNDPINKMLELKEGETTCSYELNLSQNYSMPLKMKGADKTFLNSMMNSMNHFGDGESSIVQITVQPVQKQRFRDFLNKNNGNASVNTPRSLRAFTMAAELVIKSILYGIVKLGDAVTSSEQKTKGRITPRLLDAGQIVDKTSRPNFSVGIRVTSKSKDPLVANDTARSISAVFRELDDQNSLMPTEIPVEPIKYRWNGTNMICVNEMSQFAYLPTKNTNADNILRNGVKELYDKNIPTQGLVFGTSNGKPVAFPMVPINVGTYEEMYHDIEKIIDNICKPRLILGQMGTGKSEFIINYVIEGIKAGVGMIVVDPKHDTQKRLIESIPEEYMHLVDYIDLGDLEFPAAMNMLRLRRPGDQTEISMVTQTFINFMKKLYGNSWGYAMQVLIQNVTNTILLTEIHTLYEFQLLLTNEEYRSNIIKMLEELLAKPDVTGKAMITECLEFWQAFNKLSDREQRDRIGPTMNRIGLFMANRLIRAIVSQRESYDFRERGDMGRITIINISEGILGPENTNIMSSFINKAIWLDFQSRADQPDMAKRYPTCWIIDEAHTLVDEEFVGVLTKSRSYRLGLTLITQGLTNFKHSRAEDLAELVLTNCKNKICFRLGIPDARQLGDEFAPLTAMDLANIPDYHFYSRILLEGGKVSDPFFAKAPLPAPVLRNYEEYVQVHRTGKMTIDDIEEDTMMRHGLTSKANMFSANMSLNIIDEELNTTNRKKRRGA